jgi:hypothetical protein
MRGLTLHLSTHDTLVSVLRPWLKDHADGQEASPRHVLVRIVHTDEATWVGTGPGRRDTQCLERHWLSPQARNSMCDTILRDPSLSGLSRHDWPGLLCVWVYERASVTKLSLPIALQQFAQHAIWSWRRDCQLDGLQALVASTKSPRETLTVDLQILLEAFHFSVFAHASYLRRCLWGLYWMWWRQMTTGEQDVLPWTIVPKHASRGHWNSMLRGAGTQGVLQKLCEYNSVYRRLHHLPDADRIHVAHLVRPLDAEVRTLLLRCPLDDPLSHPHQQPSRTHGSTHLVSIRWDTLRDGLSIAISGLAFRRLESALGPEDSPEEWLWYTDAKQREVDWLHAASQVEVPMVVLGRVPSDARGASHAVALGFKDEGARDVAQCLLHWRFGPRPRVAWFPDALRLWHAYPSYRAVLKTAFVRYAMRDPHLSPEECALAWDEPHLHARGVVAWVPPETPRLAPRARKQLLRATAAILARCPRDQWDTDGDSRPTASLILVPVKAFRSMPRPLRGSSWRMWLPRGKRTRLPAEADQRRIDAGVYHWWSTEKSVEVPNGALANRLWRIETHRYPDIPEPVGNVLKTLPVYDQKMACESWTLAVSLDDAPIFSDWLRQYGAEAKHQPHAGRVSEQGLAPEQLPEPEPLGMFSDTGGMFS